MDRLKDRIFEEVKQSLGHQLLTDNRCYKAGSKIVPVGIMTHSTGANNAKISRYIPGDNIVGLNAGGNHWNNSKADVCVHGIIGKDKSNKVRTYQLLPWNVRGWHAGKGLKGSANNTHISYEICEDALQDKEYTVRCYEEAKRLNVYLSMLYNIQVKNMICHSEGYKLGIASNHADIMHWWSRYGLSMEMFRWEIQSILDGTEYTQLVQSVDKKIKLSSDDYWVKALDGGVDKVPCDYVKSLIDKIVVYKKQPLGQVVSDVGYWTKVMCGELDVSPQNLVALFNKV